MMPKLACADFTFPLLPHEKVLQLIAMLEFKGVDIGLFEDRSHLCPSREFENVTQSARQLKKRLDAWGLEAADIFLQVGLDFKPYAANHPEASHREKARDWFIKTLDYTAECECEHVTGLPGAHFETESYDDSFARAVEELNWRVDQAKAYGIVFGVEAHIGSIVPEPGPAEKLVQQVPGLTLTLDYAHFTRIGLPDAVVEPLVKYASHFHVEVLAMSDCKRPLPITQLISNGFWKSQMRMDTAAGSELSMSGQNGRTATRVTICQRRFCFGILFGRWLADDYFMVNSIISYTPSMHSQPPNSPEKGRDPQPPGPLIRGRPLFRGVTGGLLRLH